MESGDAWCNRRAIKNGPAFLSRRQPAQRKARNEAHEPCTSTGRVSSEFASSGLPGAPSGASVCEQRAQKQDARNPFPECNAACTQGPPASLAGKGCIA